MLASIKSFLDWIPIPIWAKIMLSAMIPMVEARYSMLFFMNSGFAYWQLFALSVIGNLIPVPIIIYFFRPLLKFLRDTKLFSKIAIRLEERTHKKASELQKYSAFGLFVFVALPIPGTGALTGAMVAALLDMREAYALPAIVGGAIVATLITTGGMNLITYIIGLF